MLAKSLTVLLVILPALGGSLALGAPLAEDRLQVEAKLDGKAVKLVFDTGCYYDLVLTEDAVKKLGFTRDEEGRVPLTLAVPGTVARSVSARVIAAPPTELVGILGWRGIPSTAIRIDWEHDTVTFLGELPDGLDDWLALPLSREDPRLVIPSRVSTGESGVICLDTGMRDVGFAPEFWEEFLSATTPRPPLTLDAGYSPAAGGFFATEMGFLEELPLGRMVLRNVFVKRCPFKPELFGPYLALLGVSAMRQFEIVLHPAGGRIYLKPRKPEPRPPDYNRLGAVFVPRSFEQDELLAHVLPGSPAHRIGLRDGDRLLRLDGRDVTKWRTASGPRGAGNAAFSAPPGTMVELVVMRKGLERRFAVKLSEILPVPAGAEAPGEK